MARQTRRGVIAGVGGGTIAPLFGGAGTARAAKHDQSDGRADPLSTLKVAHMSPDAPNVDVYVDGLLLLEDVPFTAVSRDFVLGSGEYTVLVTPTGEDVDAAVIDARIELGGRAYTAIATGEVAGENRPFYPLVHPTNLAPLGDGTARLRAFHLSPDASRVDVAPEGGDPLFAGVDYTQNRTAEVPAGDYTLELRPAGSGDVVTTFDVSLAPGVIYTGYVVGYAAPGDAPADQELDLVTSIDAVTPAAGDDGGADDGNDDGEGQGDDDDNGGDGH